MLPSIDSAWTAEFIISTFAAGGVFAILFYMAHQVPLQHLINTLPKIRIRHVLVGMAVGLAVFLVEIGLQTLFLGVKEVNFNLNPFTFFKALSAGVLLGVAYSINLSVAFGYVFPAATRWLSRPQLGFWAVWFYMNLDTFISVFSFDFMAFLPFLLVNSLVFMVLIGWTLLDDGIEMMIGYMVGSSMLSNAFLKIGVGVGSWGKPVIEVILEGQALESWYINIVRAILLLLITLFVYRYMKWKHVLTRLFSRYSKPVLNDEWTDKIDEIGEGKSDV